MLTSIIAILGVAARTVLSTCVSLMTSPVYAFAPQVTVSAAGPTAVMADVAGGSVARMTKVFDNLPGWIGAALAVWVALNSITAIRFAQADLDRQYSLDSVELTLDDHRGDQEPQQHTERRQERSFIAPQFRESRLHYGHGPRFTSTR